MPETESLSIGWLKLDDEVRPRVEINSETVDFYAAELQKGAEFPAITVFRDECGNDWVADGFHRVLAYQKAGIGSIKAQIIFGDKRDAIIYAVGQNKSHGLRRNRGDVTYCVVKLLNDPEWFGYGATWIAEKVGCTRQHVNKIKRGLTGTDFQSRDHVIGRDGRKYNVKKIRSNAAKAVATRKEKAGKVIKETEREVVESVTMMQEENDYLPPDLKGANAVEETIYDSEPQVEVEEEESPVKNWEAANRGNKRKNKGQKLNGGSWPETGKTKTETPVTTKEQERNDPSKVLYYWKDRAEEAEKRVQELETALEEKETEIRRLNQVITSITAEKDGNTKSQHDRHHKVRSLEKLGPLTINN